MTHESVALRCGHEGNLPMLNEMADAAATRNESILTRQDSSERQPPDTKEDLTTDPSNIATCNELSVVEKSNATPKCINIVQQILADQWFLIALGLLIAIASQVQVPLSSQELKRTVTSYLCISIIFFVYVVRPVMAIS